MGQIGDGGDHTGRRREAGDRNEKQQWGLEQRSKEKRAEVSTGLPGL